jgi:competence protein ComEA
MDRDPSDVPATRARALLRAADQATVAFLVGCCFLAIVFHGCYLAVFRQQRIDFDQAPPLQIDFQIDVNTADWPELTLLPGIGETLARRIVAYREQHGPFHHVDQLLEVKGIGPKKFRRIRGYLRLGVDGI